MLQLGRIPIADANTTAINAFNVRNMLPMIDLHVEECITANKRVAAGIPPPCRFSHSTRGTAGGRCWTR
ncbi:MAG: hypothetical protein ABI881_03910 [Betaproteobacteria bacterium]